MITYLDTGKKNSAGRLGTMSELADAGFPKTDGFLVSSDGVTQAVTVQSGKEVTVEFIPTPAMATGALGTAHGSRMRRAEQWAAGRKRMKEEGKTKGRKRGRGAQLRRQMVKQEKAFREWRAARGDEGDRLQMMQPGVTRAEPQRHGCTRLLMQLTRTKMELAVASREKAAAEVKLDGTQKEVVVLENWYKSQEAVDMRLLQSRLHEEKMKVKAAEVGALEAAKEVKSMWEVLTSNGELHARTRRSGRQRGWSCGRS